MRVSVRAAVTLFSFGVALLFFLVETLIFKTVTLKGMMSPFIIASKQKPLDGHGGRHPLHRFRPLQYLQHIRIAPARRYISSMDVAALERLRVMDCAPTRAIGRRRRPVGLSSPGALHGALERARRVQRTAWARGVVLSRARGLYGWGLFGMGTFWTLASASARLRTMPRPGMHGLCCGGGVAWPPLDCHCRLAHCRLALLCSVNVS